MRQPKGINHNSTCPVPSPCDEFLERARRNVEKWGNHEVETLALAIAEETGEVCQAIMKARWEGGDRERIRDEVIDLGALCYQMILSLEHAPCPSCDSGYYQFQEQPKAKP